MKKSSRDLYDPTFVSGMFDRMSKTYGLANLITSFGFSALWRKQCVADLPSIAPNAQGLDLMSGMGESWGELQKRLNAQGRITAIDISEEMNRKAQQHLQRLKTKNIEIRPANILENDIRSSSADFIISTFGIKTFSHEQQKKLASEVSRILKAGGSFSMIEISEPKGALLKGLYMLYLKRAIPLIGRAFLRNADGYRMLGQYCTSFQSMRFFYQCLKAEGLQAHYKEYFFGCATGVYGIKPQQLSIK